jgi:hypothetical protein
MAYQKQGNLLGCTKVAVPHGREISMVVLGSAGCSTRLVSREHVSSLVIVCADVVPLFRNQPYRCSASSCCEVEDHYDPSFGLSTSAKLYIVTFCLPPVLVQTVHKGV